MRKIIILATIYVLQPLTVSANQTQIQWQLNCTTNTGQSNATMWSNGRVIFISASHKYIDADFICDRQYCTGFVNGSRPTEYVRLISNAMGRPIGFFLPPYEFSCR